MSAPPAAGSLSIEIVADTPGFAALEPAWRALAAQAGEAGLAQGYDWAWRAWTLVAAPFGHRLRLVVGRAAGQVVLIWPLVLDGRYLKFLSCELTEYHDVLLADDPRAEDWLAAAWHVLTRRREAHCLLLADIRADARLAPLLAREVPRMPRGACTIERRTWLIDLAAWADWDSYAASLPPRLVADQRRQWKRAAELADGVAFRAATGEAEIVAGLDWFFAHKTRWLEAHGISTRVFASAEYRAFLTASALDAHRRGAFLLGRLTSGAATLSVGFGFVHDGSYIFQSFVYDPAFARLSPSRLLLEHLVRASFGRGLAAFDFMPGETAYKMQWSNATLGLRDHILPLSWRGRLAVAWHRRGVARIARSGWLRRQYRRLPRGLRHVARRLLLADVDYSAEIRPMR
ncbi:MAG: GNAT family N-acetyltransferase [Rhodospirillales bacterium]|nr:GNAT family N-acetyltransferase [Rhodospirillales bacterium]